MIFISRFYWILERKVYLAKMNNLPKHHGAGPAEARGPTQLHRVYRLKVGHADIYLFIFWKDIFIFLIPL